MGLIHSWDKNCGKSMTLYLLSKLQGLATRQHPLLLSGGNQSTSGTSAYVLSHVQVITKSVQSMQGSLLKVYLFTWLQLYVLSDWLLRGQEFQCSDWAL